MFSHCLKLLHQSPRLPLALYIVVKEIDVRDWNYVDQLDGKIMPLFEKVTQEKLQQSYTRKIWGLRDNFLGLHIVEESFNDSLNSDLIRVE